MRMLQPGGRPAPRLDDGVRDLSDEVLATPAACWCTAATHDIIGGAWKCLACACKTGAMKVWLALDAAGTHCVGS